MAIQFVIIHNGTGYDVSNMFEEITWSGRKGAAPRSVSITLMDDDGYNHSRVTVDCANGDQCVFYEGGKELFRGIITSHKQSNSKKLVVKAYDNAYYLANNKDSFCYTNKTATDIFNDCMSRLGMTGNAVDTSYVIPELPKAKTTYYDVMLDALSTTYKATGERYYISSENGTIYLRKRVENAMQWVLEAGSSQSNLTSYEYSKSIEKIRTRVRLLSKEDAIVYEKANTELESKIGTFMEVKSVDDSYTAAQMQELVESIFDEKGTPEQSLKVSGMGVSEAVSGKCVYVIIPHLGLKRSFFIDEDTHKYTRESHTMENLQNQKSNEELVAIPEKYMLTIREAASYFNIGIKNMRRLCESNEGEFSVRWGNKYLICRPKLEAYLNQLMVRERNKNDVGLEENHGVS